MLSLEGILEPQTHLYRFVQSTLCLQNLKFSIRLQHFTMQDYFKLKNLPQSKVHGNFTIIRLNHYFYTVFMPAKQSTLSTHVNVTGIRHWYQLQDSITRFMVFLTQEHTISAHLRLHAKNCSLHTVDNVSMSGGLPDFINGNNDKKLDLWKLVQFFKLKSFVHIRYYEPQRYPGLMISFRYDQNFSFYRHQKGTSKRGIINIFPSKTSLKKVSFQGFKSTVELVKSYLLLLFLFLEFVLITPPLC